MVLHLLRIGIAFPSVRNPGFVTRLPSFCSIVHPFISIRKISSQPTTTLSLIASSGIAHAYKGFDGGNGSTTLYPSYRGSREFEEYAYDFHRKKGPTNKESLHKKDDPKESKRKKVRTPTFNQLTGPYHEPFCLDIYISKAAVRACIIHRATSKVVAVAHSISKDMKFDLGSTRDASACAAVGSILAQRALDDDIHDVVYTPRKGNRIERKLQIDLQSIIDNGINVKVKLKQRRPKKTVQISTT
ncbi:2Fe-2S ferredoxin-like superfamily protein [Hibiscus syriacus]|uniref:2Fe-2S ferredoxin-like superfamily protein n=1 Tax=Hibiscus syriacus TaxID=106335 RepID=A0A6A3BDA9_HIBSY|nr:2Fe-2S ferredoxin-like superfamily protein [Hibiscus syriacus]